MRRRASTSAISRTRHRDVVDPKNESAAKHDKPDRWQLIDFGLIHTVFSLLLINVSNKTCGVLTILTSVTISIFDSISDLVIAANLFSRKYSALGLIVLVVDYLPGWTLALHNVFSAKWRAAETIKQKLFTLVCLIFSPFTQPLFHLKWLYNFERADQNDFDVLHHNSRLSQLLSGSYESPMQIILLLVLWARNKIEPPWSNETCVIDSAGRCVCLGVVPGILSLTLSLLSLLKGSIDVSEGKSWREKYIAFIYAMSNYAFRLPSIALAIMYFNEWSLFLFVPIIFINLVIFVRFDQDQRKDLSTVTSVIVATITPFLLSDQAHIYQRRDVNTDLSLNDSNNNHRRKLASRLSMVMSSMLSISNLCLFYLLKYNENFTHYDDITIQRHNAERILSNFLLPVWGLAMASSYLYGQKSDATKLPQGKRKLKTSLKLYLPIAFSVLIFTGIIVLSGVTLSGIDFKKGS